MTNLIRKLLLLFLLFTFHATVARAQTTRPIAAIDRAIIISIDGLRPDVLLRAKAPNLRALMDRGSFTMYAITTDVAITLPSHVSMLTGVKPARHGVDWNEDLPPDNQRYPKVPTLFQLAKQAGYTTAMAAGKSKFTVFNSPTPSTRPAPPAALDWIFLPQTPHCENPEVATEALAMLRDHRPQLLFIHLPSTDNIGHAIGWGTTQQLAPVETADAAIGDVLAALKELDLAQSTFILITSDHGGAGIHHGPGDFRSRYIPWIAAGPGIRAGYDLTRDERLEVHTEDTFATVCALLAIPTPNSLDGRMVDDIVDRAELLHGK